MKTFLNAILILFSAMAHAQYYYNDIIGTTETNTQMKTWLAAKVKTVTATGIDPLGERRADFSETQEIRENGLALKIITRTNGNTTIYYNRFDEKVRLVSITDSSSDLQSITQYHYDTGGRIDRVQNSTRDTANDFNQEEVHQWIYGPDGRVLTMWRIINGSDSLEIRFTADENGNTGDEKTYRKGVETGVVYYYYDDKKRLTDIVRYNTKAKRLMPDIMFEYDDQDRVIQKITTTSSLNLGYLIWRFGYNTMGLKTREALFNHARELTGKIEYNFTFNQ